MNTLTTSDHLLVIDPCSDTQARIANIAGERVFSYERPGRCGCDGLLEEVVPDIVIDMFLPTVPIGIGQGTRSA